MLLLLSTVLAQTFDCDYSNFKVQPISEYTTTFPSYPAINTTFYAKFVNYKGFPVASSSLTTNQALLEASKWVCLMFNLAHPSVKQNMISLGSKMAVMARYPQEKTIDVPEFAWLTPADYWNERARGLGATTFVPTTETAEENILCDANDRYLGECILIHEFAHSLSDLSGNQTHLNQLENIYVSAMSKSLWKDTYSATNSQEYWAEGVQSWFDCNQFRATTDGVHGPISTRDKLKAYDPDLAALIASFFGDTPLRYSCPGTIPVSSTTTTSTASLPSTALSSTTQLVTSTTQIVGSVPRTVGSNPISTKVRVPDVPTATSTARPTQVSSATTHSTLLYLLLALF